MTTAIRHVVVAGVGAIGWIAAIALRRTFKHTGLEVTVVDVPEQGAPRARWTLPSQRGAHMQVGLAEADFLRAANVTYRLASEFRGWQGEGSSYLHTHGEIGTPIAALPFYKYLLWNALAGRNANLESFALSALAARQGRFARPMGSGDDPTATFTYGYHLDERPYVALLRTLAGKTGVKTVASPIADLARKEDGGIDALVLENQQRLSGDLFVDCTGAAATLISRLDEAPRHDWSRWLPCDRCVSGRAALVPDPPALTRLSATDAGWTFEMPLADATFTGHVYSAAHLADEKALQALGPGNLTAPEISRISAGRRAQSWVHNCIALGGAAFDLEPLAGANLHLAQVALATLLELFPLRRESAAEAAEFNRLVGEYADSLRDFTLAHYRVSRRSGAFWESVRGVEPPETLAAKLELYAAGGRIDIRDHEVFEELDWVWLLLGAGVLPRGLEWQMARTVAALEPRQAEELRQYVGRLAQSMPRHLEYLQRVKSAPPRAPGATH